MIVQNSRGMARVVAGSTLAVFCLLIFVIVPCSSSGQENVYTVYAWFNNEQGKLDPRTNVFGKNADQRVQIVPYSSIRGAPRGFRDVMAVSENGDYGMLLKTAKGEVAEDYLVGMAGNFHLDRNRLGANGRALFQADFYVPPAPAPAPSIAVLAMEPMKPGQKSPVRLYRFGMTKNIHTYFSYVKADDDTEPPLYHFDSGFFNRIPRGTWHRFAIVCRGRSEIRCYIDGQEAPFSPIHESSLKNLQVGVMLADNDNTYNAYVDNLSIQWTDSDVPIPESPWIYTWTGQAPSMVGRRASTTPAVASAPTPGTSSRPATLEPIVWYDVKSGWEKSQSTGKPLLVYFLAPRVPGTGQVDRWLANERSAQILLNQYTCIKIDVSQLQGGTFAQKFNIFKVPTIIIFNSNGKEASRAVFSRSDTWASFEAKLKK